MGQQSVIGVVGGERQALALGARAVSPNLLSDLCWFDCLILGDACDSLSINGSLFKNHTVQQVYRNSGHNPF
jgi:hypothetical protein